MTILRPEAEDFPVAVRPRARLLWLLDMTTLSVAEPDLAASPGSSVSGPSGR